MDRVLFSKIRELLPSDSDTISFLKDTDLEGSFELELLKGLHRFVWYWNNPEFEFMDAELESRLANLFEAAHDFLESVALNTFPCTGLPRRNEIPPEWRDTQPSRFNDARQTLNDLATDVYNKYEDLIRAGRRRLAVS